MALVRPFKAIRYNREKIKDLSLVVAPPYDIIPKAMQEELYKIHPFNIVRLILGKIEDTDDDKDNRYTRAKKFFESWLGKGVLIRDRKDSIYIYSQNYRHNGKSIERIGFMALMGLDSQKGKKVLPHENTLQAPKTDRFNLMKSVGANLSPIFVLYDDSGKKVMKTMKDYCGKNKPLIDISFEGVRNRVWRMDDVKDVKKIERLMNDKDIFIADGHHRYEVARLYHEYAKTEQSNSLMVYFVASDEDMLTVLPAHRIVKDVDKLPKGEIKKRLGKFFHIKKVAGLNKLMAALSRLSKKHVFGLYLGKGEFYILILKSERYSDEAIKDKPKDWKRLDVSILHLFIFQHVLGVRDDDDNIEFIKDPKDVVRAIDSGKDEIAFFLNPTKAWQVKRIARIGERMPRKATYFYPKPLSGLVINKLTD